VPRADRQGSLAARDSRPGGLAARMLAAGGGKHGSMQGTRPRRNPMTKAAALACFAVLALGCAAFADDHDAMDPNTAMEEWQKYMNPGEAHQKMEYFVGDWKLVNTSWMMGPDQPMVSEGTMKAEMILGGRYLRSRTEGEMMGMPFEGISISGYDNVTKEWFNLWLDNMGTGVMISRGGYDENGDMVVTGIWPDPMMGEIPYRMVSRITGPDTYVFDMYTGAGDDERHDMQVKYTRVKSS
jgi:hypothetical protein